MCKRGSFKFKNDKERTRAFLLFENILIQQNPELLPISRILAGDRQKAR